MPKNKLQQELDAIAVRLDGRVAYALDHPASSTRVERNAQESYIAASVIKVPILAEAFRQVAEGMMSWDETMVVMASDKVGGSGVLTVMHDGLQITPMDAAVLMTVVSDNTATNMLIGRLGVDNISGFLRRRGCLVTRCVRKLYDWPAIKKGIHNYISAGEITDMLRDAASGKLVDPSSDAAMLDIMKKQHYRDRIPHLLPKGAVTANKTGDLDEVEHDAAVVWLPNGDWFALTICVGDLQTPIGSAERAPVNPVMAEMAAACYRYVESLSAG